MAWWQLAGGRPGGSGMVVRVRAGAGPSGLPETAQLRGRHLMAKVEETRAGSRAGAAPRSAPRRPPTSGSSSSK